MASSAPARVLAIDTFKKTYGGKKFRVLCKEVTKDSYQYCLRKKPLVQKYMKAELMPPSPLQIPQYFRDGISAVRGVMRWREKTVGEVVVSTLVIWEVCMWYFLGEVLGKFTIIGYDIPGTVAGH